MVSAAETEPTIFAPALAECSVGATCPLICLWKMAKSLSERRTVHSSRKYLFFDRLPFLLSAASSALLEATPVSSSSPTYSAMAVQRILNRINGDPRRSNSAVLTVTIPSTFVFNPRRTVGYLGFSKPLRLSCPRSMWLMPNWRSLSSTDCSS